MQSHESGASPEGGSREVTVRESLSALMDGESQPLELQRVLKCLGEEDALRETWARYQITSALLRKQSVDGVSCSLAFADRVQQALQQEPATRMNQSRPAWSKFAVAASVAIAVVAGTQWQQRQAVTTQPVLAQVKPAVEAPAKALATPNGNADNLQRNTVDKSAASTFLASQSPDRNAQSQQVRFENYMQYHLERASLNDGRGMVPLSRKVSVEER